MVISYNSCRLPLILAALLLAGLSRGAAAQDDDRPERAVPKPEELRSRFDVALSRVDGTAWSSKFPEGSTDQEMGAFTAVVRGARGSVDRIWASKKEFSPLYLISMDIDCKAMEIVTSTDGRVSRPIVERARGAAFDLQLKAKAAQTDLIPIEVRTLGSDTTQEVQGCVIMYAPYFDDAEKNWERFPQLSSPSKADLPPGIWAIWARKGGKHGNRERLNLEVPLKVPFEIEAP